MPDIYHQTQLRWDERLGHIAETGRLNPGMKRTDASNEAPLDAVAALAAIDELHAAPGCYHIW